VTIGVVTLYLAVFAIVLAGAGLVITPSVLVRAIGTRASLEQYVHLAWLTASFAAVAGGLGAALQSHEAVREDAYAQTVGD
jgi:hypothetical protein